jgi:hypothetical protein
MEFSVQATLSYRVQADKAGTCAATQTGPKLSENLSSEVFWAQNALISSASVGSAHHLTSGALKSPGSAVTVAAKHFDGRVVPNGIAPVIVLPSNRSKHYRY